MAELDQLYENIRQEMDARLKADPTQVGYAVAQMLLSGLGFSNQYSIRYRNEDKSMDIPTDSETGLNPLVGLDLSRMVDLGYHKPDVPLCPGGLENLPVAGWYVGDRYLSVPGSFAGEQSFELGGFQVEEDQTISPVVLQTTPENVFTATQSVLQARLLTQIQINRLMFT